jgi:hypothetical protein
MEKERARRPHPGGNKACETDRRGKYRIDDPRRTIKFRITIKECMYD